MMVEIRKKYIILYILSYKSIITSLMPIITSPRSSDEAMLVKMYPTQICQYPGFVVKGLIEIRNIIQSNETRYLFSTKIENVKHSKQYVKTDQHCNTFQFMSK